MYFQSVTGNKYDVLKPWSVVKDQIQKRFENEEEEVNTCLSIGLQVDVHTFWYH